MYDEQKKNIYENVERRKKNNKHTELKKKEREKENKNFSINNLINEFKLHGFTIELVS